MESLTNLAWFYLNEKYEPDTSLQLMLETIQLQPQSYVPYNLLGEIYIRTEQWQAALETLLHAIRIQPTEQAHNNLAVAYYHLGQLQEAAEHWSQSAAPSDFAMYSRVICLIQLGQGEEAKMLLETFSEKDDEFVGCGNGRLVVGVGAL
ncbi:tetratricopeptide repeat protein [Paenibacillus daejeonensis]|uniref:tetratricopeptide repeat protein n=1 Tax=Paenibacillus daejeonensis TaxID=135193 RepID=UPI00039A5DBA|nr:tetratricopeptide repeat protein [Paenibacillus daejeonensis]